MRVGIYALLANDKYDQPVDATVLYIGEAPMRMVSQLDVGATQVRFRLIDIRDVDYRTLLKSRRPGDWVLAMLAQGGTENLRLILQQVCRLPAVQRDRALSQMALLSGLRQITNKFKMELATMGATISVEKNAILRQIRDMALAQGMAEGEARGEAKGAAQGDAKARIDMISRLLVARFGPLPKWASTRIQAATPAQVERWVDRIFDADTLEAVIGRRAK